MSETEPLDTFFERAAEFEKLHAAYVERGVEKLLDDADKEMDGSHEHYFEVGADAVRASRPVPPNRACLRQIGVRVQ